VQEAVAADQSVAKVAVAVLEDLELRLELRVVEQVLKVQYLLLHKM
jgi:hypothetical protein